MPSVTSLPDYNKFTLLFQNLYRATFLWQYGPIPIPVSVFLVHVPSVISPSSVTSSYSVLIDAGHRSHVESLSSALSTHLQSHPEFPLKYVFLTHGHHDHTAALPTLLRAYPELKVVIARNEYPFVVEGEKYRDCTGDTCIFQLFKGLAEESKVKVDKEYVMVIESGEEENTIFGNAVKVVRTNGHTPGSLSFLHIPSNSLVCGDALMNLAFLTSSPSLSLPVTAFTVSVSGARSSIKQISERQDVDYVMPAHDLSFGGVPIEKVREFASKL